MDEFLVVDKKFSGLDFKSPRDSNGHGSHTASTTTDSLVSEASLFCLGSGTARWGVPSTKIIVHKTRWLKLCPNVDILVSSNDAIVDCVNIISILVEGFVAFDYFENPIAIESFHAMKNRVLNLQQS